MRFNRKKENLARIARIQMMLKMSLDNIDNVEDISNPFSFFLEIEYNLNTGKNILNYKIGIK